MSYLPVAIFIIVLLGVLALYYILLRKRDDWATTSMRGKVELFLLPLPIVVGLIGALAGYEATNKATLIASRAMDRDSMTEVRRAAETAVELYGRFLLAVDLAYGEAEFLKARTSEYFENQVQRFESVIGGVGNIDGHTASGERLLHGISERYLNLVELLEDVDRAIHEIAVNPLANSCYRRQWGRQLDDLFTTEVSEKSGSRRRLGDDFVLNSLLFRIGSSHIKAAVSTMADSSVGALDDFIEGDAGADVVDEESVDLLRQLLGRSDLEARKKAQAVVFLGHPARQLFQKWKMAENRAEANVVVQADENLKAGVTTFLFLGNLISTFERGEVQVLHGAAVLGDLIQTMPDDTELDACLEDYYEEIDEGLWNASQRFRPAMSVEDVTPTLFEIVFSLEKEQLSYGGGMDPTASGIEEQ